MSIRAVFVDFGGVLVRTEDEGPRSRLAEKLGMTRYELEELVFESESSLKASLGEITEDMHLKNVVRSLNLDPVEVSSFTEAFFAGDRTDPLLLDYLRSLRPGHKVGLISNAWSGLRDFIARQEMADLFDAMTISAEAGTMKPYGQIYRIAMEELQVQPDESVFVDDMRRNVEGARSVGMHAIHFTQPAVVLEELKELLNNNR
jgi:epoxide hydrolase-like predicted phosphatase